MFLAHFQQGEDDNPYHYGGDSRVKGPFSYAFLPGLSARQFRVIELFKHGPILQPIEKLAKLKK